MLLFLVCQLVGYGLENKHESINNFHKLKRWQTSLLLLRKNWQLPYEPDRRQKIGVGKFFPFGTSGRFHPRVEKEF